MLFFLLERLLNCNLLNKNLSIIGVNLSTAILFSLALAKVDS